jgi:transposase
MRKQINGLSIIAEEELKKNPFSGNLFLFCNRTRKLMKAYF